MPLVDINLELAREKSVVNTPSRDNARVDAILALAHQLIAARLNVANGSDPAPGRQRARACGHASKKVSGQVAV